MRDIAIRNNSRIGGHIWGSNAESRNSTKEFFRVGYLLDPFHEAHGNG